MKPSWTRFKLIPCPWTFDHTCRSVIILVMAKLDSRRFAVIRFRDHSFYFDRIGLHSVLQHHQFECLSVLKTVAPFYDSCYYCSCFSRGPNFDVELYGRVGSTVEKLLGELYEKVSPLNTVGAGAAEIRLWRHVHWSAFVAIWLRVTQWKSRWNFTSSASAAREYAQKRDQLLWIQEAKKISVFNYTNCLSVHSNIRRNMMADRNTVHLKSFGNLLSMVAVLFFSSKWVNFNALPLNCLFRIISIRRKKFKIGF